MPYLSVSLRLLEPVSACLVPVVGLDGVFQSCCPYSLCPRWCWVNQWSRAPQTADVLHLLAPVWCGLVNARSIQIKTFILEDLFSSQELDFLFVTETWLNVGESIAFTELLPTDCYHFNSLQRLG